MPATTSSFKSVYGPVQSWRFGRSLGIDPIGEVSTCSFNCVYCQLGEIEYHTWERQVFVPTEQIRLELETYFQDQAVGTPPELDVITLSGSGEPTLAANLGDILTTAKQVSGLPVGVLTNSSLLTDARVREELAIADQVEAKVDAGTADQFYRVNRPVPDLDWETFWQGLRQFRQGYGGFLAVQTMLLSPWNEPEQTAYLNLMRALKPQEIHLNTPTRPRPLVHQLDARGNHDPEWAYPVRHLKPVSRDWLQRWGDHLQAELAIPVRCPPREGVRTHSQVTSDK
jgi:wyosine [tRNA(Phe)-imidazoG37] synthetase (radical SAM superfamily)